MGHADYNHVPHTCDICGSAGAVWAPIRRMYICRNCLLETPYPGNAPQEAPPEYAPPAPGTWHDFNRIRPEKDSPYGFLVILPGTRSPVLASFDEMSKRFSVYCVQIGGNVQVPVEMWFQVPEPPGK